MIYFQKLSEVANCGVADAEKALKAAHDVYEQWGFKMTAKERAAILINWYNLMMKNKDELARIITCENVRNKWCDCELPTEKLSNYR